MNEHDSYPKKDNLTTFLSNLANILSIASFAITIGLLVWSNIFPIETKTEDLAKFTLMLLAIIAVHFILSIVQLELYSRRNRALHKAYATDTERLKIEKSTLEVQMKKVNDDFKALAERYEHQLLINAHTYKGCHSISHELRDYNHHLVHELEKAKKTKTLLKNTYFLESGKYHLELTMIKLLDEAKLVFQKKTRSSCSVAVKKCYEGVDESGKPTYAVSFGYRDNESRQGYQTTDDMFINSHNTPIRIQRCYEYAYIFDPSNGENYCLIVDSEDQEFKSGYFHALYNKDKDVMSFRSKIVTTIGYRGKNRSTTSQGMDKLYGFLEVECKGLGLGREDHDFVASVADRLYSTFRLFETCYAGT